MSEIQEIDVYLNTNGTVKIEVRGAKGQKCLEMTKEIESQLGGRIIERIQTDDFYKAEEEQQNGDWIQQQN